MAATKVTVLMPVYNGGLHLKEAIQSIINQTFTDFELMIINDGSTDKSEEIIAGFNDARIKCVKHHTNKGLIDTLNEGLDLAKSEYIIRMDADDISLPQRLAEQVSFMDANPDIAISGTLLSVIDRDQIITHPAASDECKVMLLQNTVLGHPSVILRREVIMKHHLKFDKEALHAEDYKFWADASTRGLKIANIPQALVQYRVHNQQISIINSALQLQTVQNIKLWYAQFFFGDLLKTKLKVYLDLLNTSVNSFTGFMEARKLITQLKTENRSGNYFNIQLFEDFLDNLLKSASFRIYVLCVDCNWDTFRKSIFDKHFYHNTNLFQKAKFVFRSIQKSLF